MDILNSLRSKLDRYIEGSFPFNNFIKAWKDKQAAFKVEMSDLKPVLIPRTAPNKFAATSTTVRSGLATKHDQVEQISLDSDEEDAANTRPAATPSPSKKRKVANGSEQVSPQKCVANLRPVNAVDRRGRPSIHYSFVHYLHDHVGLAERFKLEWVKRTLSDLSNSGLPNEIDPKATSYLISLSTKNWHIPMNAFLDGTEQCIQQLVGKLLGDVSGRWRQTDFYKESTVIVNQFLDDIMEEQRASALHLLQLETFKPLTLNDNYMDWLAEKELEQFSVQRFETRVDKHLDEEEALIGKRTEGMERVRRRKLVKSEMIGPDPFQKEVETMARVRGYYGVASMRFVDQICLYVQGELMEKCRTQLSERLIAELGVYGDDGEWCSSDPSDLVKLM